MPSHDTIYDTLGVRPVINCGGFRSFYGNSVPGDAVRDAMTDASRHFVLMSELAQAAGERLAVLTGAPWGLVTAGSAAALALAASACVAASDPLRMLRLPDTAGMPSRVLVPAGHRFAYDQGFRTAGCRIEEVADEAALKAALARPGVAFASLYGSREDAALPLEVFVRHCRPQGIPVLVDAASEWLQRPERWTARGADLVIYSVGKVMRGPAATGLLLGRRDLVEAAWRNGPPHQSSGRAMKLSKEQIVGALVAVSQWLDSDHGQDLAQWHAALDTIEDALDGLPQVRLSREAPHGAIPSLRLSWQPAQAAFDFDTLRQRLLDGSPRILIDDFGGDRFSFVIAPLGLRPGEAALVGAALARQFRDHAGPLHTPAPQPPALDASGRWTLALAFANGACRHLLDLRQDGGRLHGTHTTPYGNAGATGTLTQDRFEIDAFHALEGNTLRYRFSGSIHPAGRIHGQVLMGAGASHTQGPTTFTQFGSIGLTGTWTPAPR